jgi:salicylate hydroxylase
VASLGAAKVSALKYKRRDPLLIWTKGRKTVARADLLEGLAKLIQSDRMHFGKRLASIQEKKDKKVTLYFEDGSEASADCLIGADGIHSKTRDYLLGEDHPAAKPKDQGWVLFRRLVPIEEARRSVDAKLLSMVPIYCGKGSAINCMPIHGGRTYTISVTYLKSAAWSKDEAEKALVVSKDFYKDWIPEVRTVVEVRTHQN